MASLYRQYRPRTFDQVVGQEHVVRTLRNAVEQNRISHAYLFSGPRGTGKTSLAKILAKALNCVNGPTPDPDGTCERCVAIHEARSLDVIELDAASHRGIDDIREIRERVALHPVEGRYKVYILDEAHSLTADASNALLKTLEEPPEHVVFVLCTTESAKLLPTIRSRCQRLAFNRPGPREILKVLRGICDAEGITASDEALSLIARAGAGSFRDPTATLDQIATTLGGTIDAEGAASLLGVVPEHSLDELIDLIASAEPGIALDRIDALAEGGHDLADVVTSLLAHLRLLYLIQHSGTLPGSVMPDAERYARLEKQAAALPPGEVLRSVDLLTAALAEIREGADPRLPLEVAVVKAARPQAQRGMEALLARLERLEGGAPLPPLAPAAAPRPPAPAATPVAAAPDEQPPTPPRPVLAPAAASSDLAPVQEAWSDVVGQLRGLAHGVMMGSRPVALVDGRLTIGVNPVLYASAARCADEVARAVAEVCALRVEPAFVVSEVAAARIDDEDDAPAHDEALPEQGFVERFKSNFDATEVES
jgi:DNA polymerase-3 subunit gamma/tau